MCKLNSAAHDRIIMPHCPKQAVFIEWVEEVPVRELIISCKGSSSSDCSECLPKLQLTRYMYEA